MTAWDLQLPVGKQEEATVLSLATGDRRNCGDGGMRVVKRKMKDKCSTILSAKSRSSYYNAHSDVETRYQTQHMQHGIETAPKTYDVIRRPSCCGITLTATYFYS